MNPERPVVLEEGARGRDGVGHDHGVKRFEIRTVRLLGSGFRVEGLEFRVETSTFEVFRGQILGWGRSCRRR